MHNSCFFFSHSATNIKNRNVTEFIASADLQGKFDKLNSFKKFWHWMKVVADIPKNVK